MIKRLVGFLEEFCAWRAIKQNKKLLRMFSQDTKMKVCSLNVIEYAKFFLNALLKEIFG